MDNIRKELWTELDSELWSELSNEYKSELDIELRSELDWGLDLQLFSEFGLDIEREINSIIDGNN